jgi:hypothetical protein
MIYKYHLICRYYLQVVTDDELFVRVAGAIDLLVHLVAVDLDPMTSPSSPVSVEITAVESSSSSPMTVNTGSFPPNAIHALAGDVLGEPQGRMAERRITDRSIRSDELPDRLIRHQRQRSDLKEFLFDRMPQPVSGPSDDAPGPQRFRRRHL